MNAHMTESPLVVRRLEARPRLFRASFAGLGKWFRRQHSKNGRREWKRGGQLWWSARRAEARLAVNGMHISRQGMAVHWATAAKFGRLAIINHHRAHLPSTFWWSCVREEAAVAAAAFCCPNERQPQRGQVALRPLWLGVTWPWPRAGGEPNVSSPTLPIHSIP
jgi:hypothetical protein